MPEIVGPVPAIDRERMQAVYREGGRERRMAPHVVYSEAGCPHAGCGQRMQAIDFRLEDHGRGVCDPLVRAWRDDTEFAGRCPRCGGWVHFTLRAKRAITAAESSGYPRLPDNRHLGATIL